MIELFEFNNGEFNFLKQVKLTFHFSYGVLLNERFLVHENSVDFDLFLEIIDLDTNKLVYSEGDIFSDFQYISQDNIVYLRREMIGISMFSFTDDGLPFLTDDHPLHSLNAIALDRTPGDSHFIFKENNDLFTCTVVDGVQTKRALSYDLPKNCSEIVRVLGTVVPSSSDALRFTDVYCKAWDFVLLNNEICCIEYEEESGRTGFFELSKRCVNCFTVLGSLPLSLFFSSKIRRLNVVPIVFNYIDESVILLHTSKECNDELQKAYKYFNSETRKWEIGYLTSSLNQFDFHTTSNSDSNIIASYEIPECVDYYGISFNNRHFSLSYTHVEEGERTNIVNGYEILGDVERLTIVGDSLWYVFNGSCLVRTALDYETGEIIEKKHFVFERRVSKLVCNPYCSNECVVQLGRTSHVMRYSEELKQLKRVDIECGGKLRFIEKGILLADNIAFLFNNGVDTLVVPSLYRVLYSPKPYVAIAATEINKTQLKINVLTFDMKNCSFSLDENIIDLIEFLSQCNVSQSFSFGTFGTFDVYDNI
ncbi:hypothetical protein PCE1_003689 [Barthelona sp. PCE]